MKGAGGTSGGIDSFFMGLIMMCIGFYMLLNSIIITSSFGSGSRLYNFSAYGMNYGGNSLRVKSHAVIGNQSNGLKSRLGNYSFIPVVLRSST